MKIIGVIPARYKSSRFEGKPLADICGKPMVWWVYQAVKRVKKLDNIYVATDHKEIAKICEQYGIAYIVTSNHETSTERLYEVATKVPADLYICINGDEPLIEATTIEEIIPNTEYNQNFYVANLMTGMKDPVQVVDNTNIKVVVDSEKNALFMSRSPIPYPKTSMNFRYYKHLGVLIYNLNALKFFSETSKNYNELIEDINELRFIENGKKLKMIEVQSDTLSVDTPKDLEIVRNIIQDRINSGEIVL